MTCGSTVDAMKVSLRLHGAFHTTKKECTMSDIYP